MTATATDRLSAALDAISDADEETLGRITKAINARRDALRAADLATKLATVTVGTKVTLTGLSPKYLNDLTGEVTDYKGGRGTPRVTVTLDEASTRVLRYSGGRRFFVPADATSFPVAGVPVECCTPQ